MNKRLFGSLRQQLKYEIFFAENVSSAYIDDEKKLEIVDFKYKNQSFKLTLNGKIRLEKKDRKIKIESYKDLIKGLIRLNGKSKKVRKR